MNRIAKVNFSRAGGTAGKDAQTCKVSLPISWLRELGINEEVRDMVLSFDRNCICIAPKCSGEQFAAQKKALGHTVKRISYYDQTQLCSTIYADFTDQTLVAENHVEDFVKTAFGNYQTPDWSDFMTFLSSRCIPSRRAGLREYLEAIGVGEYDPLEIIQKTQGRMAEDRQWLCMEDLI